MKKIYEVHTGEGLYGGASGDDYQEVRIYRARLWVFKKKRNGQFEAVEREDFMTIGNLKQAESRYQSYRNTYQTWIATGSQYRGFVELFEAFVWADGSISAYPAESGNYIDRETTEA